MGFHSLASGAADPTCFGHWSLILPDPRTTAVPRSRRAPGPGLWLPRASADGLSHPLEAQEDLAPGRGGFTLCARREILLASLGRAAEQKVLEPVGSVPQAAVTSL